MYIRTRATSVAHTKVCRHSGPKDYSYDRHPLRIKGLPICMAYAVFLLLIHILYLPPNAVSMITFILEYNDFSSKSTPVSHL